MADDRPSFTIYRMRFTDDSGAARDIAGVLGGLEITDEGAGGVLPHERTTPKASTDRLDLTRATRRTCPRSGGCPWPPASLRCSPKPGEPVGTVTENGVEHAVERVTDVHRIGEIQKVWTPTTC